MTSDEIDALLADFREWLTNADELGDDEADFELTLVEQFTALRHEVNLLTRTLRAQGPVEVTKDDDRRPFVMAALEAADAWSIAQQAILRRVTMPPPRGLAKWFRRNDVEYLDATAKGLSLGRQRFALALQKLGVEHIETIKQPFDPETMEALEVVDFNAPPGTVVEEVRAGYRWNGKVVRFAQVRVAK